MKRNFFTLLFFCVLINFANAQDSLLVYKSGKVLFRKLLTDVDSITFPPTLLSINKGLVAKYTFSGNANDVTGNGNNGVNYGATLTTDRFDNANSAYYFDGYSHINCGSNSMLNLVDSFTICVWAKTNIQKNNMSILSRWRNNEYLNHSEQFAFYFTNTTVQAGVYTNGWTVGNNAIANNFNYYDNLWHFYTMSFDGLKTRLYIDGSLAAEINQVGKVYSCINDLLIGYYSAAVPTALNLHWVGKIDDIRIYNRALNLQEINTVYTLK